MSDAVAIRGLDEFRRELARSSKDAAREFARVNQQIAEPIAEGAKSRARSLGGAAAKGADSIKAKRSQKGVGITGGGGRHRYFWGAEFGARRYRQFEPWTGNQWVPMEGGVGYFLHPEIRDRVHDIDETYLDAIDKFAKSAFPD